MSRLAFEANKACLLLCISPEGAPPVSYLTVATVFWKTSTPDKCELNRAPEKTWRYRSHSILSVLRKKMHQPGNPFFGWKASYVNQGLTIQSSHCTSRGFTEDSLRIHVQNPMIRNFLNQSHLVQLRWTIQNEFIFKVAISYAATPFVFMFRHLVCRISPAIPNVTTASVI